MAKLAAWTGVDFDASGTPAHLLDPQSQPQRPLFPQRFHVFLEGAVVSAQDAAGMHALLVRDPFDRDERGRSGEEALDVASGQLALGAIERRRRQPALRGSGPARMRCRCERQRAW